MIINYKDKAGFTSEIISIIHKKSGIRLSDLKISDLILPQKKNEIDEVDSPVRATKQVYYVGKCYTRTFVERIPMHFDLRPNGWFNPYLKYLANHLDGKEKYNIPGITAMERALAYALTNHELILIRFDINNADKINQSEKQLIKILLPKLNTPKKFKQ
jgi:hypothetical protein